MENGFSLIEVLIALILFSVVMAFGLQSVLQASQQEQQSSYRSTAYHIIAQAANALQSGDTDFILQWRDSIAQQLPQGKGNIEYQSQQALIHLRWFDKLAEQFQQVQLTVATS